MAWSVRQLQKAVFSPKEVPTLWVARENFPKARLMRKTAPGQQELSTELVLNGACATGALTELEAGLEAGLGACEEEVGRTAGEGNRPDLACAERRRSNYKSGSCSQRGEREAQRVKAKTLEPLFRTRFLLKVHLAVPFLFIAAREAAAAHVAGKRLLARVSAHVRGEVVAAAKVAEADAALEGFVAGVDAQVAIELVGAREAPYTALYRTSKGLGMRPRAKATRAALAAPAPLAPRLGRGKRSSRRGHGWRSHVAASRDVGHQRFWEVRGGGAAKAQRGKLRLRTC